MRRFRTTILILLMVGTTLFGQVVAQQNLHQVRVATLAPSALLWLNAIADDQGFYAENGVQVQAVQAQSSAALVQAVASGSADAGVALGDNTMRAIDEGAPIIIAGAVLSKPILRLYGTAEDVPGLRGARVTGGAVTGGTSDLLLYILKQGGVQPAEVEVVGIPNSRDRLVGMQSGQLEGGLLIAPFDVLAERSGINMLATYPGYWLQTPLVINRTWAEANPEAAGGITKALAQAAAWIYDEANRTEAVRILAEFTNTEPDVVQEAYDWIVVEQQAISPDLSVPEESLRSILEIAQAVHGGEMPAFEFSKYYDAAYLGN